MQEICTTLGKETSQSGNEEQSQDESWQQPQHRHFHPGGVAGTPKSLQCFLANEGSHFGGEMHKAIVSVFSMLTAAAKTADEVTFMSVMKNHFSCGMSTQCGIPSIVWMPLLLPLLDEFVQSHKGNANHGFWQSMVKLWSTAPIPLSADGCRSCFLHLKRPCGPFQKNQAKIGSHSV